MTGDGAEQRQTDAPPRRNPLQLLWDDLHIALHILARFSITPPQNLSLARITEAKRVYPLVGALIGAIGGLFYWSAHGWGLGPLAAAIIAVTAMAVATGLVHEKGLARAIDALEAARNDDATRRHDLALGAVGAGGLMLMLVLTVALIARIHEPFTVATALIAAGALSRAGMVFVMAAIPPVEHDADSIAAGRPTVTVLIQTALVAGAIGLIALGLFGLFFAAFAVALFATAVAALARAHLGGQTPDVLGAVQVICQAAVLAAAAVYAHGMG
jgi:adenosylcobinamide-GDP ribazoletransferase